MRYLVLAALFAPSAAFACAMPHYEEKKLAQVMDEIDAAAAPAPKPAVTTPTVAPTPAPSNAPPATIPEVAAPVVKPAS